MAHGSELRRGLFLYAVTYAILWLFSLATIFFLDYLLRDLLKPVPIKPLHQVGSMVFNGVNRDGVFVSL